MNPFADYRLTSPFGMRIHPVDKVPRFHKGVDLVTSPSNGPLYAFVAGEVLHAKIGATGSGFGNMGIVVAIKDDRGYLHVYAHLSGVVVKVGQVVERGQMIGRQGSTGKSTGPHLHYEIRKKSSPSYGWTESENGVVEPTQYLVDYYKETEEEKMLEELAKRIEQLEKQAERVEAPAWFVKEFGSADLDGQIHDPRLTAEGWRVLAIGLRVR